MLYIDILGDAAPCLKVQALHRRMNLQTPDVLQKQLTKIIIINFNYP